MSVEQISIWGAIVVLILTIGTIITSPFWGWRIRRHKRLNEQLSILRAFNVSAGLVIGSAPISSATISVDAIVQHQALCNHVIVVGHLHSNIREFFRSASRPAMLSFMGAFVASAIAFIIIGRLQPDSTFLSATEMMGGIFFAGLEIVLLIVFVGQYHMIAAQVDKYEHLFP